MMIPFMNGWATQENLSKLFLLHQMIERIPYGGQSASLSSKNLRRATFNDSKFFRGVVMTLHDEICILKSKTGPILI